MHIQRSIRFLLLALGVVGLLAACGQQLSVAPPDDVQVNGVSVERVDGDATGKMTLSVSGLDSDGNVVTEAAIHGASATVDSVEGSDRTFTATAEVCGDITATTDPVATAMMLDETGSMRSFDPDGLRFDAAQNFVDQMRADDVAALARFSTTVATSDGPPYHLLAAEVVQDFTGDKDTLRSVIENDLFHESGRTPLWDASHDAITMVKDRSEENKVAVVMTDGIDNESAFNPGEVNAYANENDVLVLAVGFGGASAADLDDLVQDVGFRRIVEEEEDIAGMFDTLFAAVTASGCIEVALSEAPDPGTVVVVSLDVTFEGDVTRSTTFRAEF